MNMPLIQRLTNLMRETADKLDAGNSHISESEAMYFMGVLCHEEMSKAQVCKYLNISRAKFDMMVRRKEMPKGMKVTGFTELRWYKGEIDKCLAAIKNKQK